MKELEDVEWVRAMNNKLWCRLLKIALESNPSETKEVLRQINANDQEISRLLGKIAQ